MTPKNKTKKIPNGTTHFQNDGCGEVAHNNTPNWEKSKECDHEIGRKVIGGFIGHEQIHPTGEQFCLNCGKTLKEILSHQEQEVKKEMADKIGKMNIDVYNEADDDRFPDDFVEEKDPLVFERGYNQALQDLKQLLKKEV